MILVGVAAESEKDAHLVESLIDRVLVEGIDWIDTSVIKDFRTFVGVSGGEYLAVRAAKNLAQERGLRLYGDWKGRPQAAEAMMYRRIFLLFADETSPPSAVVVSRDIDHDEDRVGGFKQAANDGRWAFEIVGALADPEIEAWLVAGWTPDDKKESSRLNAVRKRVGFDPTRKPERLTSKKQTDKKDAKRILEELCKTGRPAAARWATTPLNDLTTRGRNCGLADFIARPGRRSFRS